MRETSRVSANAEERALRVPVFPSYLYHSVDANASGEIRTSVSFNMMFSGSTAAIANRCGAAQR